MDNDQYSVVMYAGDNSGYRCGYCKSSSSNYSLGMHSYYLTADHYQALIDRGWRRSGTYCYKPTMNKTCCPAYTIRCDAMEVKLSKSQKKVLKRMNNFLAHGITPQQQQSQQREDDGEGFNGGGSGESIPEAAIRYMEQQRSHNTDFLPKARGQDVLEESSAAAEERLTGSAAAADSATAGCATSDTSKLQGSAEKTVLGGGSSKKSFSPIKPGVGADPSKPVCRKARDRRLAKKEAKLQARQNSEPSPAAGAQPMEVVNGGPSKKNCQQKSIEDYFNEPLPDGAAHKLELRLVREDETDPSMLATTHQLFKRYQKSVHRETDPACNFDVFHDFLVDTPLRKHFPSTGPSCGYGSFHQQYWLDDHKLIAVAVIDILPTCVSSVYFYYDPDYSFLSLGTYSSLREMALVRQLQRESASLRWYYMGFYIHSCPKMRYKGRYQPSYLLCPETYGWQAIETAIKKLEVTKYARLADQDIVKDDISVDNIKVLYDRRPMRYRVYRQVNDDDSIRDNLIEYASLVGSALAYNMLHLMT